MKKFIIKILAFSFLFLLIDKVFILVKNYSPRLEVDKRLEKIITGEIDSEIIVLGSSRGARNILAKNISQELGTSCLNLSYPGSNINFHEFLLEQIIKFSKTPKTLILTIDPDEIRENESLTFRFDRLYPLVKYPAILDELIKQKEKNYLLSKFLILHQLSKDNFSFIPRSFSELDTITVCGSMPISFQRKDVVWDYKNYDKFSIESEKPELIKSLRSIQDICKHHGINLVLAFPPNYNPIDDQFVKRIKALTNNNLNYFIYDSSNEEYRNKDNFYDKGHLNIQGANIYTNELANYLKSLNLSYALQ